MSYVFEADTAGNLLSIVCKSLLKNGKKVQKKSVGSSYVVEGNCEFTLTNPYARYNSYNGGISVFYQIAELIQFFSYSKDAEFLLSLFPQIKYHVDKSDTSNYIHGSLGYRAHKHCGNNQVETCIKLLKTNPETTKAIIQIWDANLDQDTAYADIPTCLSIQFLVTDQGELETHAYYRSGEILSNVVRTDIFILSYLMEYVAASTGLSMGKLTINVPNPYGNEASLLRYDSFSEDVIPLYDQEDEVNAATIFKNTKEDAHFLADCAHMVAGGAKWQDVKVTSGMMSKVFKPLLMAYANLDTKATSEKFISTVMDIHNKWNCDATLAALCYLDQKYGNHEEE